MVGWHFVFLLVHIVTVTTELKSMSSLSSFKHMLKESMLLMWLLLLKSLLLLPWVTSFMHLEGEFLYGASLQFIFLFAPYLVYAFALYTFCMPLFCMPLSPLRKRIPIPFSLWVFPTTLTTTVSSSSFGREIQTCLSVFRLFLGPWWSDWLRSCGYGCGRNSWTTISTRRICGLY